MKRTLAAVVAAVALGLAACGSNDGGAGGTAAETLDEAQIEYLWISDGWNRGLHTWTYAVDFGDVAEVNEAARKRVEAVDDLVSGFEEFDWPDEAQDEVDALVEAVEADREVYQRIAEADTEQELEEAFASFTTEVPPVNGLRRALDLPQLDPPPEGSGETDPSFEEGWTPSQPNL